MEVAFSYLCVHVGIQRDAVDSGILVVCSTTDGIAIASSDKVLLMSMRFVSVQT